ncbi:hypothetical protein IPV08_17665 [Methylobacterium sp. SD274]|uniref:hypothetical protein n=1 Tax=unclassified Methylobacterium TaxID=2615210 RepID=UPI000700B53E|nr:MULTISPECIES: hypothetical protein [unclassified Methylobacterium]KQO59817.1 hypothetical protein ASF24_11970 [Methylobacterium sp. Leaf86]KQO85768.1 hypothetical protein ASF32_08695 [Methylobacterium sp. Leaf91]MBO1021788.1 hypothetical protein [Methylobacterium sp. SD274]
MTEKLTTAALCDLNLISQEEVAAAVEVFLANSMAPPFVFKEGYRLDLGKAVRRHPGANDFVNRGNAGPLMKRPFVLAAILQARPMRG